jgi:hypothetical protein
MWLKVRTAQLYCQLAERREAIEAAIMESPELSLRGAIKLVASTGSGQGQPERSELPDNLKIFLAAWEQMNADQRRAGITFIPLSDLLGAMSAERRLELERRLAGQILRLIKAQNPNLRVKRVKLALVKNTGSQIPSTH